MFRFYDGLAVLALIIPAALPAAPVPIDALFEQPQVGQVKISPTGEYLAIKVFEGGVHSLLFVESESMERVGGFALPSANEVGDYFWANRERVVAEIHALGRSRDAPRNYGELAAVNYDGSRSAYIFGYRSRRYDTRPFVFREQVYRARARVIDLLSNDDRWILISSTYISESNTDRSVVMMLDVYNAWTKRKGLSSKFADGIFLSDVHGDIRLVASTDATGKIHVEGLPAESQEWIELPGDSFSSYFRPVAISDDLRSAYVLDRMNDDTVGLYNLSLDGKAQEIIYANSDVDVTDVQVSKGGRGVYAVRIDRGYPGYVTFSGDNEEASVFKDLLQSLPGRAIDITSRSSDGRFWTVRISSDIDAGSFYLFDRESNSLRLLFRSPPKVDSENLSAVEPIEFGSFDGRKVTGYFTEARRPVDAVAPLVVLVHGGPNHRDFWTFNPEVQALATRGYSVLQVNYRGSSGFGEEFQRAGNLHWGNHVQQDIISGTRWAIATGRASRGRICIMGTGFGAYSAVQSAILEPTLFSCAVANGGIYDLELLYERGDLEPPDWDAPYLEEVVGRDEEQLRQFSPVYNVASLEAPVFIAHDKKDRKAPYTHARRLKRELDRNKKPYVWFEIGREADGFYDTEDQVEFMKAALEFLNVHLYE